MQSINEKEISIKGWTSFYYDGDLLALASAVGKPVPTRIGGSLIDTLAVKDPQHAHPNSLSARFGRGSFPFHTDGAHHEHVPRYLYMRLVHPESSERKTLIQDFRNALNEESSHALSTEMWRFRGGPKTFLSPILGNDFLRLDPCVMSPAITGRTKALNIVQETLNRSEIISFGWKRFEVLVLDNHRMVHARDSGNTMEIEERTLERVLII
jgi:alpha-ketoglutarate-dependent taurine dioxygenase